MQEIKNMKDINVPRKKNILQQHIMKNPYIYNKIPNLSLIEFNITELCNRKCIFCPRGNGTYLNREKFMEISLYKKILHELNKINYSGKLLFSAFSEPLMHKKLSNFVSIARDNCPNSRIEIVTNGDYLTSYKLIELIERGLDCILVSLYDGEHQKETYSKFRDDLDLSEDQLIIRERYDSENDYGMFMSNRSGLLSKLDKTICQYCFYPFYQILIDYDGIVLSCPHDWGKTLVVGDVGKQSLVDIWNGKLIKKIRIMLSNKNRCFHPCNVCDVEGIFMGKEHFNLWMEYYEKS